MAQMLWLQSPTEEERSELGEMERLADARTAPSRLVEPVRMVVVALAGEGVEAIAARFQIMAAMLYSWLHCFHGQGIAGLEERPRKGRPPTYTGEQVATGVATAFSRHHGSWANRSLVDAGAVDDQSA